MKKYKMAKKVGSFILVLIKSVWGTITSFVWTLAGFFILMGTLSQYELQFTSVSGFFSILQIVLDWWILFFIGILIFEYIINERKFNKDKVYIEEKPKDDMALKRKDIQKCIKQKDWQEFRLSLKGLSTNTKKVKLREWLKEKNNSKCAQIQVANYVNALKRAGLM